jgi:hypothetical protein
MNQWLGRAMLGGLLLGLPVWAAPEKGSEQSVPARKASFEKSLKTIIADCNVSSKNWVSNYVVSLKELQSKLQKAGDLEGWTEAKNELDRISAAPDAEPGIPADALSSVDVVLAVQKKFRDVPAQLVLDKNQKIVALSKKYLAGLTAMQTDLTKQGKMDEALVVNAEIKRVKGCPEVVAAESELTNNETDPASEEKSPPISVTPPSPVGKNPAENPPEPFREEGDVKIYTGKAPASSEGTFKPMRLIPTSASGVRRRVNVSAWMTSDSNESGSSYSGYYGSSRSSSGSTSSRVRVGLKPVAAGSALSNIIVVVEYYCKDVKTSSGKIAPSKTLFRRNTVPRVDVQGVCIDYPEASLYKTTYKSTYYYGSGYKYKSGQEFYGIVISVYEGEKTLIFQAVSAGSLVDLAPKDLPSE